MWRRRMLQASKAQGLPPCLAGLNVAYLDQLYRKLQHLSHDSGLGAPSQRPLQHAYSFLTLMSLYMRWKWLVQIKAEG